MIPENKYIFYSFGIILLLSFLIPATLPGQKNTCDQLSKRDKKHIKQIKLHNKKGSYVRALRTIIPLYKEHPECAEVQFLHGFINYNLKDNKKAIQSFEKAFEIDPDVNQYLSYTLGKLYYDQREYEKAIEPLSYFLAHSREKRYVNYARKYLDRSQERLQILQDSLLNFKPFKLSQNINTDDQEYLPALSADNQAILFTRRLGGQEDIYMSRRDSSGNWKKAIPVYDVNTPGGNEGGHCFSADGRILIFTSCRREMSYGSCDLLISFRRSNGRWSTPKNMGPSINTAAWESQPSLSPDKRYLYFSSTRDSHESNIYYATLQSDGTYGDVKTMGKPINTDGNERAPFMAFDNETFYFASDGHPGLGQRDIFMTRKDSVGKWQKPVNLGPPLNSEADDGAIFINSTANLAYFSSDKEESVNIYAFEPDSTIAPKPVTYIEGNVYDKDSKEPLVADISIMRLVDSTIINRVRSNADGYYLSTLPVGFSYAFWVDKEGYIFHSSHHEILDTQALHNPFHIDIPLKAVSRIKKNTKITLNNVLFETGSSKLLPEAMPELNKLLNFMQKNPDITILIQGHTDDVGTVEDNLNLSNNRASSVKNYLINHGINRNRLSSKGFGESQPIVPNNSDENRALNRRTEVVIK